MLTFGLHKVLHRELFIKLTETNLKPSSRNPDEEGLVLARLSSAFFGKAQRFGSLHGRRHTPEEM